MGDYSGNTMVEVMVSFAVTGMLAAIFANIMFFSGRAAGQAEKRLEADSKFFERYYLDDSIHREKAGEGDFRFYRVDGEGRESFVLGGMAVYRCTDEKGGPGVVYDVEAEEDRE